MSEMRFYISNSLVEPPENYREIEFQLDWKEKKESAELVNKSLVFKEETANIITERCFDGLNGGLGMYEGIPFRIEVGELGNPLINYEGYLNPVGSEYEPPYNIKIPVKKYYSSDWITERAEGFSFASLYDEGIITSADFQKIQYVINYIPDGFALLITGLAIFQMTKTLIEAVRQLATSISELTNSLIPSTGTGVVWDLGDVVWVALNIISQVIYVIALVIGIKELIEQFFDNLIQKKRDHLGMSYQKMMIRGLQKLGLTLNSSLLNEFSTLTHLSTKDHKGGDPKTGNDEVGHPTLDDPIYNFGDYIRYMIKIFNADFRIIGNVFEFERRDHWKGNSNFTIPDTYANQKERRKPFTTNANEIKANTLISFATSSNDLNTLDDQDGRLYQAQIEPINVSDERALQITGLDEIEIPFALGYRKDDLDNVEKLFKKLAQLVDNVTSTLGSGTNFASQIENRKGSLLLTDHRVSTPKMLHMSGKKLTTNQQSRISSKIIFDKYQSINNMVPNALGEHNQKTIIRNKPIQVDTEVLKNIFDNHYAKTTDGKDAEIFLLKYKPDNNLAIIDYNIEELFTKNLKLTYYES